jgi:hypothetical protein
VRHRRFHRRRLSQVSAKITASQKPQRYLRRIEGYTPALRPGRSLLTT